MRRCIGSAKVGIAPPEARTETSPLQPSQRDGLGRLCPRHANADTAGLARDATARRAAQAALAAEPEDAEGVGTGADSAPG